MTAACMGPRGDHLGGGAHPLRARGKFWAFPLGTDWYSHRQIFFPL